MPLPSPPLQQQQQHRLSLLMLTAVPLCAAVFAALVGYRAGASRRLQEEEGKAKDKNGNVNNNRDARRWTPAEGVQHHPRLRQLIGESTGRGFGVVKRVYVVPGGGPGSAKDAGYPPWTAHRVDKALQRYDEKFGETTAFIALGAGSMNAPSARGEDGRVVFESTRIVEELVRGGVPPGSIIADFASWDTVGNAWFARVAVEAILDMSFRQGDRANQPHAALPAPPSGPTTPNPHVERAGASPLPVVGAGVAGAPGVAGATRKEVTQTGTTQKETKRADAAARAAAAAAAQTGAGAGGSRGRGAEEEKLPAARAGEAYGGGEMRRWMYDWKAKKARARKGPLNVTVFVSDFHAERMDAVFQWVFGLEPSLLRDNRVTVTTVSIDTPVEVWAESEEEGEARRAHEREAADQARQLSKEICTVEEFRAFMVLGGHHGYYNLSHGGYRTTSGGGWGGGGSS